MQIRVIAPRSAAVAAGWWVVAGKTCVAAYQPKGAASLAASYTNLASPGVGDATVVVAPTWDVTSGWKSANVNNGPLLTLPSINDNYTILLCYSNWGLANDFGFGIAAGGSDWKLRNTTTHTWYGWGNALVARAPALAAGVEGMADNQPYRNGATDGGAVAGTWASGAQAMWLFRTANPGWSIALYVQALAIWSDTLTAGEVATVSAAMAAL